MAAKTPASTARLPVNPGDVVGERYRLGRVIGEGGMGVVLEAQHIGLEAPVAVKIIRTEYKDDTEFMARFVNEARAAAALKGEHIARVHDVGRLDSGEPYLVMERLDGVGLEDYLTHRGPLEVAAAVGIVLEVCAGLAEAHALGLVHRDIKPANLFLTHRPDGRSIVKILDFGIAKRLAARSGPCITNPERSLGSPWYMSPEQMIDPSRVDQRSDIWSLGVLLFELLIGDHPFDGSTLPEVCAKVLSLPAPPLHALRRDVEPALALVVARCLAKDPDDRFWSVAELAESLVEFGPAYASRERVRQSAMFPADESARRSGFGTLAPLGSRARRTDTSLFVLLAGMLAVAASTAIFSYAHAHARARGADALDQKGPARLWLPGDPALPSGPEPSPLTLGDERISEPIVAPIGGFGYAAAPSEPSRRSRTGRSEPPLTSHELEQRGLQYERWLTSEGLLRADEVPAVEKPR